MRPLFAIKFALFSLMMMATTAIEAGDNGITKSLWNHNGSEMVLEANGSARRIYYWNPRAGLSVNRGAVLFVGERVGNQYQGNARLFRSGCDPADYWVTGTIRNETDFVLHGAAPVRNGCTVVGYDPTSGNATLRFTYIRRLDY
jgi:hypothetical protein